MRNILRMEKRIDALTAGNKGAKKNCEYDSNAGQTSKNSGGHEHTRLSASERIALRYSGRFFMKSAELISHGSVDCAPTLT